MAKRLLTTQRIVNLSSDPGSATAGELYYNTSINSLKYYDGSQWSLIGSGEGGASVTISETPPVSPELGDLWYESDTAKMFIYYDNTWVEIGGGGGGATNSFQTIDVPSGTDPVADSATDTLTFTADGGITITGNSSTDTIEFSTSGSGLITAISAADGAGSGLDADLLDGQHGSHYLDWTNTTNKPDPTITLAGDLTGSVTLTDLNSGTLTASIAANAVELGTDTTGQYVSAISGTANQITASGSGTEGVSISLSLPSSVIFPGTVTLNADPTQALQAATKQYVDAIAEGLHVHQSCSAATTANISNLSSPPATIDNVTLTTNMRVLVKNQSNTSQNGIYVFNGTALVRASDFDSAAEIDGGDFVFVTGGDINDNTGWVQTETVGTVGTDPIIFTQFSGAGTYTAGTGLVLNGNQFSNTGVLSVNGSTGAVTGLATTASPTFTGIVILPTSTTGGASIRIPHGVAPTAPSNGDIWTTTDGIYVRIDGETVGPLGSGGGGTQEIFYQTTAPPVPSIGTIWVDSDEIPSTLNSNDFALKNSPTFTGVPSAPTAVVGTNTTQLATTAFVNAEISNNAVLKSGGTMTGSLILAAATTSISSIRIPHGIAPSSPTNGDIWTTTSGLFGRISGTTEQFATQAYVSNNFATQEYVNANIGGISPFLLGGM